MWLGIWNTTGEANTYQRICHGDEKSPKKDEKHDEDVAEPVQPTLY